jgi:hypothetical protein
MSVSTADAAFKWSNAMDGNYYRAGEGGRGVSIDYVPNADGSGVLFGAVFSFEETGENAWITFSTTALEHAYEVETDIFLTTGGSFGFPFPGVDNTQIGTATVTANSCNSITVDFDFNDSNPLDIDDVVLEDLAPAASPNEQCVYTEEFDGCPSFAEPLPQLDRACVLNGAYQNQDLVLTNDTTWLLDGLVRIGDDNANQSTITIEPGTTLIGGGGSADYLYVSPGSKIFANGRPWAPIVLTSDQDGFIPGTSPSPGDVGGLVVSGNAPCNAAPDAPFECFSEFDQSQRFGGDDPYDSSGEISYFQVRYAGIEFQPDAEVNSFTMQGVGSGTRVHHLQAYRGQDDGIEFFGGTVNVKHMVVTEGGDDPVDWDLGYSGKLQYGLVVHGDGFGEDHGIEGASNPDDLDAQPRAMPIVSNYTFIGSNIDDGDGIQLKDGSAGQIWNSIVTNFSGACVNLVDLPTYSAAGTPSDPSGATAFAGVIIDCDTPFDQEDGAPWNVSDFFNSFPGNDQADPMLNGYMPMAGSPALEGALMIEGDDFFDFVNHRGAFDGSLDWTTGWTYRPGGE